MSDVFISYSRRDVELARALAQVLEGRGIDVFWDREIPAGETFAEVIERELTAAKCAIVLWSESSVNSDWVHAEAADAAERKVLVPALLDEVRLPLEFRRVQAANLIGWDGRDAEAEGIRDLVAAVTRLTGAAAQPGDDSGDAGASASPVARAADSKSGDRRRLRLAVGIGLAVVVVAIVAWVMAQRAGPSPAAGGTDSGTQGEDAAPPDVVAGTGTPGPGAGDGEPPSPVGSALPVGRAVVGVGPAPSGPSRCTGFFFSPAGHVLTADYCIGGDDTFAIELEAGDPVRASLVAVDETAGVGVLKADADGLARLRQAGYVSLTLDPTPPQVGDPVTLLGGRDRGTEAAVIRTIDAVDASYERSSDRELQGLGGAPVMSSDGGVVALHRLGSQQSGVGIGRLSRVVAEYLASEGVDLSGARQAFEATARAYAARIGLPPVTLAFVEPSSEGIQAIWSREERRYEVNPRWLSTTRLPYYVVLMGHFFVENYERCIGDSRTVPPIWNEFRYGVVEYILSTEPELVDDDEAASWKLMATFEVMEEASAADVAQVRALAFRLLNAYQCSWTAEELPHRAREINRRYQLLPEDTVGRAFAAEWSG